MEFDATDLVSVELPLEGDVVDVVVLDRGEHATEVADDAVLAAVVDGVAADDVGSDVVTVPADLPGGEDRLELVLVARLVKSQRRVVVACRNLLADRDGRALRVVDDVVLDDPALGPVWPDQAGLVGRRRGPGAGGLGEFKPANGDVVEVVLDRVKNGAPYVDLYELLVRVHSLEVGPDGGLLITDFGVPDKSRLLGIVDPIDCSGPVVYHLGAQRRIRHLRKGQHLVEAGSVEVDIAQVLLRRGLVGVDDPVAFNLFGERVEGAEEDVRHGDRPDVAAEPVPSRDLFRAFDHDVLAGSRGVGDAPQLAEPAAPGLDPFPVLPAVHDDGIPGHGELRSPIDGPERTLLRAFGIVGSRYCDMKLRWHVLVGLSHVNEVCGGQAGV